MKTMGEVYPRLLELPGYEEIAARPFVPPAPPPEPSLVAKAASFATAVVKHVAAGCPTRTEERQAELKAICLSCVHQQGEASKCGVCGCSNMDLKRSMRRERCPMGFWPEDEP